MKGKDERTYDAIVIGTGISGGWAAMELCKKGLKTLVLERGRHIEHGDYPTANLDTWELPNQNRLTAEERTEQYPKLNRNPRLARPDAAHHFVRDDHYPYTEEKRFDWIRSYQTGGRSLVWGRQCYRLSDLDFEANAREGIAIDWPIRYRDLSPWYDYVSNFVGISGRKEGLAHLPDGPFLPEMPLNCVESVMREKVARQYPGRLITPGRVAHLTAYDPKVHLGTRGDCQFRNRCRRGCPYGGYFSSNSSTLVVAEQTGNMTLLNRAAVREIIYDADKKRATGVRVKMAETGEDTEFFSRGVVFLNASTLNSAAILLASKSDAQPNGLGNDSDQLGRNIMDHHHRAGASASFPGMEDKVTKGRRPSGFYIPRFVNMGDAGSKRDYLRGFGYQGAASRGGVWFGHIKELTTNIGQDLKDKITRPGPWSVGMGGFGESLPNPENRVTLNYDLLDQDGLPTLNIDCGFGENERMMRKDMQSMAAEMLEASGGKNIRTFDGRTHPGIGIHEMGSARMGRERRSSVLDGANRVWACPNLYVTDGSAMTSAGNVNPSLTYMAMTARAVDHAVKALNRRDI